MTRISARSICPGTTIEFDGMRIAVRAVEPDCEPGFIWVTNRESHPRHARIGIAESVLLEV